MTMILHVLVVAAAINLSVAEVPPYKQYVQALKEATKSLVINVLSMEGHIPLLNDTRRHYIEIIHVVNYHAEKAYALADVTYDDVYYKFLNTSAPEAINRPDKVIAELKHRLDEVHNIVQEVIDLISVCQGTPAVCNRLVEDAINKNILKYGVKALVLRLAGEAANEFNKRNGKFEEVSNALNAHQYVCTSPWELKNLVGKMISLYQILGDYH